jgi:hypothetical protein
VLLQVELVDGEGKVAQADRLPIDTDLPITQWPAGALMVERYGLRVDAHLPPGEYAVRLGVVDPGSAKQVGGAIQLASQLAVEALARSYGLPSPQFQATGCFGEELCVLGFDVHRRGDGLDFVLYWQGVRPMEQSYVISTRLVDPSSGVRVWQRDAAPRNWAYPTTWWDAGEVVSDTMTCDLNKVSAGRYQLQVAVYEPTSGQVLSVSGAPDQVLHGGQVLRLGEVDVP